MSTQKPAHNHRATYIPLLYNYGKMTNVPDPVRNISQTEMMPNNRILHYYLSTPSLTIKLSPQINVFCPYREGTLVLTYNLAPPIFYTSSFLITLKKIVKAAHSMRKEHNGMRIHWKIMIPVAGLAILLAGATGSRARAEKIGVLVLGAGMDETYKPDWIVGYMERYYQSFIPGLLTGGSLEGGSCYSLIHYANEVESAICSRVRGEPVPEGTPIDIFCNKYKNMEQYPVRSTFEEPLFGPAGYLNSCYPNIIPYFIATGHSTTDPATGEVIIGPHVDDPDGPGIGIADLLRCMPFIT